MKNRLIILMFTGALFFYSFDSLAQDNGLLDGIETIIKGGAEDMSTYMDHYTEPFLNAFAYGLANGWYNTAATHKTLGFDLTIMGSLVTVPEEDFFFEFIDSEYQNLTLTSGGPDLPTLIGPGTGATLEVVGEYTDETTGITVPFNEPLDALNGIQDDLFGSNKNKIPVPMVQLGIGIVKNTELIVRYAPKVSLADFELTFLGFGIKHDIKQWIPGLKRLPIDLSMMFGYTDLDTSYDLSNSDFTDDGLAEFNVNSWTLQAIVSKKISVLTVYGAVGYNSGATTFIMTGDYIFPSTDPNYELLVTDPVNIDGKATSANVTVGARLKFAVFTLHADYTLKTYNVFTFGFGINVR